MTSFTVADLAVKVGEVELSWARASGRSHRCSHSPPGAKIRGRPSRLRLQPLRRSERGRQRPRRAPAGPGRRLDAKGSRESRREASPADDGARAGRQACSPGGPAVPVQLLRRQRSEPGGLVGLGLLARFHGGWLSNGDHSARMHAVFFTPGATASWPVSRARVHHP